MMETKSEYKTKQTGVPKMKNPPPPPLREDILISKNKLVEAFKAFRKSRNGENSNFAIVTLPDLDKMIKAATPEAKTKPSEIDTADFT